MKVLLAAMLLSGMLAGCTSNRQTTNNNMEQELDLTQEWDKVEVCWIPFHHRRPTLCTTTTTITRPRAAITSAPATLTTAGASSEHRPMPTAVSSIISTRSALPSS